MTWMIDPPGAFEPISVWHAYLTQLMTLPQDDVGVQGAVEEARHHLARAEREEREKRAISRKD